MNGLYERVVQARETLGITQSQLAARISLASQWGPSREDINRIERGERIVSDLECRVLANALACDEVWLVFGYSHNPR